MNERIKAFREYKGMSTRAFAVSLGMSCGAISLIENRKRTPTSQFISALCTKYPELSRFWLETGEGQMIEESVEAQIADITASMFNNEVPDNMLELFDVIKKMNKDDHELMLQLAKRLAKEYDVE